MSRRLSKGKRAYLLACAEFLGILREQRAWARRPRWVLRYPRTRIAKEILEASRNTPDAFVRGRQ